MNASIKGFMYIYLSGNMQSTFFYRTSLCIIFIEIVSFHQNYPPAHLGKLHWAMSLFEAHLHSGPITYLPTVYRTRQR